jgi:hypothetical protein
MDLIVNHVYRAKKPGHTSSGSVNDRMIIHMGPSTVQYDSPTVKNGGKYPSIPKEEFLAWAGENVTEGYPEGDWVRWFDYQQSKKKQS